MRRPPLCLNGLAPRADHLLLPFLLKGERPIEHREACRLRLAAPSLRLDRLLGHELRPGEQRLLRLRGFVVVAVPVDVTIDRDKLDRRPDGFGVVAVAVRPVPVDLDGLRLDIDDLSAVVLLSAYDLPGQGHHQVVAALGLRPSIRWQA